MKITKVKYSRLVSGPNWSNQTHGAEAEVEDGETPEDARAKLVLWVDDILEKRGMMVEESHELSQSISALRYEENRLERDVKELREKHAWMVNFFAKHGIDIEDSEIPF